MQGCVDSFVTKVSFLEEKNENLMERVNFLETKVERQEQYSRRTSLRIVNNWPEQKGEDTEKMVLEMANGLLNTQLSSDEIQRSHRVGPVKKNSLPRTVIVKLLSYKSKEKIQHAAKSLPLAGDQSRGIYINEDLTKSRSRVFGAARHLKKNNFIQDCWTHDGLIFIRDFNAKFHVFDNPVNCQKWIDRTLQNPPKKYSEMVIGKG